jgi:glycosyltransferase involved in cell wall biosynthesis
MSTNDPSPDISVIICTRNRSSSLKTTLECLARADRDGLRAELIVVDNGSKDDTKNAAESFRSWIPTRYLYEPTLGAFGKSHALNRALDDGGLGKIVAVLDDDMSPCMDWFKGVTAICKRWPDKDIFTGSTYIIWPCDDVPAWARNAVVQRSIFSFLGFWTSDSPLQDGQWFGGNHFWFRSRVLEGGRRFKDKWLTEADFQFDLVEQGFHGVAGPDAVAGHRIQPALLQRNVAADRAKKLGEKAWVCLQPYRKHVRQARLFHDHPLLARMFCLVDALRWRFLFLGSYLYPSKDWGFEHRLIALERMSLALEYLRVANRVEDYSLRKGRANGMNKGWASSWKAGFRLKRSGEEDSVR